VQTPNYTVPLHTFTPALQLLQSLNQLAQSQGPSPAASPASPPVQNPTSGQTTDSFYAAGFGQPNYQNQPWRPNSHREPGRSRGYAGSRGNQESAAKQAMKKGDEVHMCPDCKVSHLVINCPKFAALDQPGRTKWANDFVRCHNCFYEWTPTHQCRGRPCRRCGGAHHIMLCAVPAPKFNNVFDAQVEQVKEHLDMTQYCLNCVRMSDPKVDVASQFMCSALTPAQLQAELCDAYVQCEEQ
jgi:hypothetical protein